MAGMPWTTLIAPHFGVLLMRRSALRIGFLPLVIIMGLGCSVKPLVAATLWGTNWGGQLCCYALDVYEIDITTGEVLPAVRILGSGSRAGVLDFASDPIGDPSVIWSINYTFESGYRLLSFNPHQKLLLSNVQLDNALALNALAIDPTSGDLYGASTKALYRITRDTGAATLIGSTSLRIDGALGFDLAGNLFGVSGVGGINPIHALISVNKSTGETSKVADMDALPADIAASPEDGTMYGLGYGNDPSLDYSLYHIDVTTGVVTDVHPSLFRPSGLAFTSVPEPTTFATTLIAVVLGLIVWLCR
jgi:hypothetical protein